MLSQVLIGAAHAEAGANWLVKGASVTSSLLPSVGVNTVEKNLTLVSKISGLKAELICSGAILEKMKLQTAGSTASEAKAKLTGCSINLNEIKQVSCEPHTAAEKGVITTNELKGLLVIHENRRVVRIEPTVGETLATIETGAECLAGEKIPVLGKLTVKDLGLETEAATHLLTIGPLTEMWVVSKSEEHKATVDGIGIVELTGEHKGSTWSASEVVTGPASWNVSGSGISSKLLPSVGVTLEKNEGALLTKYLGAQLEILCTAMALLGGVLEAEGKLTGKARFTGCIMKSKGEVIPACEPHNGLEKGVIVTNPLKGVLALHAGEKILRVTPAEGSKFVTLAFPESCFFPGTVPIIGTVTLKDSALGSELVTHLGLEGPLTELWFLSKTVEHQSTLDGSVNSFLQGAHEGLKWSGSPA
jgi:hypothetical protein